MAKGKRYQKELCRKMYTFFAHYDSSGSVPSFSKFARLSGYTLNELCSFRSHEEFERAWQECIEIRRDYLIDMAISKRADASFTKFLLTEDTDGGEGGGLDVTLTVID